MEKGSLKISVDVEINVKTAVKLTKFEKAKEEMLRLHTLKDQDGNITAHVGIDVLGGEGSKKPIVHYNISFGTLIARRAIRGKDPKLFDSIVEKAKNKAKEILRGFFLE